MNHLRGEEGPRSMCWRDAIKRMTMARKEDEEWWRQQQAKDAEKKLTQEQYIESLHKRIEELEEAVERYRGF